MIRSSCWKRFHCTAIQRCQSRADAVRPASLCYLRCCERGTVIFSSLRSGGSPDCRGGVSPICWFEGETPHYCSHTYQQDPIRKPMKTVLIVDDDRKGAAV